MALDDIVRKESKSRSVLSWIKETGYSILDGIDDFWYNIKFDRRSVMPSVLSLATVATTLSLYLSPLPSRASTNRVEDEARVEQVAGNYQFTKIPIAGYIRATT